jgi:cobalamin biosynthesis protein CbiG
MPAPNHPPRVAPHMGVASISEVAALVAGGVELIASKPKAANVTLATARVT